jgi:pimeloyl-ACP methyl ester carboxylesterase
MTVQPITVSIHQRVLDDLQSRLASTRWIDDLGDDGWKYGLSVPYMRELANYWRTTFDWRERERRLNAHSHFRARLGNGLGVHFIHERGRGPAPLPIILTHGFPDSFVRFEKLVPLLTDPKGHGGDPNDAFDVIVPSLPGYAFSDKPRTNDDIFHVSDLWNELMTVHLGYDRYVAHGGDWGSTVTEILGRDHGEHVVGIHLTDIPFFHAFQKPDDPSSDEKKYLDAISKFGQSQGAYALIQGSQPQVAALGLNDSPMGLAGWIVEKFRRWSDCDGDVESRFTKDELLTNVMLYWATETINSSFRPYFDVAQAGARTWIAQKIKEWIGSSNVPAAFAMFPKDLSSPPREWAERFFNVQRWTEMPRGGHFAALEEPALLVDDIRTFFRPLRSTA